MRLVGVNGKCTGGARIRSSSCERRGLADRPVMVLSGNSRLHLAVALAAMSVGAPLVPTSQAYSLQSHDHGKLRAMADLVEPGPVGAEDASYAAAVAAVASPGSGRTVLSPADLPGAITPDQLAGVPDRRSTAGSERSGATTWR